MNGWPGRRAWGVLQLFAAAEAGFGEGTEAVEDRLLLAQAAGHKGAIKLTTKEKLAVRKKLRYELYYFLFYVLCFISFCFCEWS